MTEEVRQAFHAAGCQFMAGIRFAVFHQRACAFELVSALPCIGYRDDVVPRSVSDKEGFSLEQE